MNDQITNIEAEQILIWECQQCGEENRINGTYYKGEVSCQECGETHNIVEVVSYGGPPQ